MKRVAKASEPSVVVPVVVVAVDARVALVIPAAESGVTPLPIGILPVSAVEMLVGESGVICVGLGEFVRIRRLEAVRPKLFIQIIVADVTATSREVKLEETDISLVFLSARHSFDHEFVRVLLTARGVEYLLGRESPVRLDVADYDATGHLYEFAKRLQQSHAEVLDPKYLLHDLGIELATVLAHRGTDLVDKTVDLTIGH